MVKVKKVSSKAAKKTLAVAKTELKKVKKTVAKSDISKAAKDATRKLQRKLQSKQLKEKRLQELVKDRGVVLIKHIPYGFYEKEMYEYFKQFGRVTALKMPRSKNGKSKGFAFIEFEIKEVAKVAADTMNNYLMFGKLVKTEYIPPEKQKPNLFHRASLPWDDTTYKEATDVRRDLARKRKNNSQVNGLDYLKVAEKKIKTIQNKLLKKTGVKYKFQVNDPDSESVQLVSVKPASGKVKASNSVRPKKQIAQQQPVVEIDETDPEIQFNPPPNMLTKIIRSSKTKLQAVKSNAETVKNRVKTKVATNTKVKTLKSKINKVKNNVIKDRKASKKPAATSSKATRVVKKVSKPVKNLVKQSKKAKK